MGNFKDEAIKQGIDPAKSRKGKNSRQRGNAFEREIAKRLNATRTGQFGGKQDVGNEWLSVQCKVGGRALAELNLGRYQFYRGLHRGRYKALRSYPEGVHLPCTRNGVASTAQYINIHKGSSNPRAKNVVWSEGCLTIVDTQYNDWHCNIDCKCGCVYCRFG